MLSLSIPHNWRSCCTVPCSINSSGRANLLHVYAMVVLVQPSMTAVPSPPFFAPSSTRDDFREVLSNLFEYVFVYWLQETHIVVGNATCALVFLFQLFDGFQRIVSHRANGKNGYAFRSFLLVGARKSCRKVYVLCPPLLPLMGIANPSMHRCHEGILSRRSPFRAVGQ